MKKFTFLLITTILFFFLFNFCNAQVEEINKKKRELKIIVDPRFELLRIVQLISSDKKKSEYLTSFDFPYKQDAIEYFSPFKDHKAVIKYQELARFNEWHDGYITILVYLTDPPELKAKEGFRDYVNKCRGNFVQIECFFKFLSDFAEKTDFMQFYKSHKGTYQYLVNDAQNKLHGKNPVDALENYMGMKQESYTVIVSLLQYSWTGWGPSFQTETGGYGCYE